MKTRNASFVYRLLGAVLLSVLALAPAPGAVLALEGTPAGGAVILMPETLELAPETRGPAGPDLTTASNIWSSGGAAIIPGSTWTIIVQSTPIQSAAGEEVDSWYWNGPTDNTTAGSWTIASIGNAPANNRGNGLAVGQAYQQPQTGSNTSYRAHAYWGYAPGPVFNYVNAATITPPTRSWNSYYNWGVYEATPAPGGPAVQFATTFNVPSTWTSYLCPGALAPDDQYVGLSGVDTDPNWMEGLLYSSDCNRVACPADAGMTPIRSCRQPAVSVAKTGRVTDLTAPPQGGPGTMTVKYCFVVTNATTPGAGVHLASYRVTDSAIGYDSGAVAQALAPGASAPEICAPDYTYNVTWPPTGSACVTNTSGASATGTTPSGWGETTAGVPDNGFSTRTFTSAAATGGAGLQVCMDPTAAALVGFSAAATAADVTLAWETAGEADVLGFNLYRDTSAAGPGVKLNAGLIRSQGPGSPRGYRYSYLDAADLIPGTLYTYWLEDLSMTGEATRHDPVSVIFATEPTAVGLAGFGGAPALPAAWPAVGLALAALAAAAGARRTRDEG